MNKQTFFSIANAYVTPRFAGALFKELSRWETSSGVSWTVSRLKTLKLILLGSKKVDSTSGYLSGSWGNLVTSSNISFHGKLTLLNAFKAYIAVSPLPGQREKFYDSAASSPTPSGAKDKLIMNTRHALHYWKSVMTTDISRWKSLWKPQSLLIRPFSHQKSIPGGVALTQFHAGVALADFLTNPLTREWLPTSSRFFTDLDTVLSIALSIDPLYVDLPVGKIQYIQEPGLKLRVIANPNYASQWFLEPLKAILLEYLRGLPSDCTFDQMKGVKRVQEHLKGGGTSYCFDMSDASNNLDREVGIHYIRGIVSQVTSDTGSQDLHVLVDLFRILCEGTWITPEGGLMTFTRGTPLGTGPSFPAMSITHHAILASLGARQQDYVLLGDDIVIFQEWLAKDYRVALLDLGIPISEDKSIISNSIAEFAGKIITSNSIHPNYKWQSITDTNVLEVLRLNGTESIDWIPLKLRSLALVVASLPVYLGGLSWTIPKKHRFEGFDTMRELLISRTRNEPSIWYQSKRSRFTSIISQIPSIIEEEWTIASMQVDNPYPLVPHFVVDEPNGFDKHGYFATSNPKARSSSGLIRMLRGLVD